MKNKMINYTLVLSFLTGCQPSGHSAGSMESAQLAGVLSGKSIAAISAKNKKEEEILRDLVENSNLPLKAKEFLANEAKAKVKFPGLDDVEGLRKAQSAFFSAQSKIASNSEILHNSKNVVSDLLTATALGAKFAGVTAPTSIAIEATNMAVTKSIDFGISVLEGKSQEEAQKILAHKLKSFSAKELKNFDALKSLSPDKALVATEKMVNAWFPENNLKGIEEGARAQARTIMTHWVARTALAKLAEFKSAQEIVNKTTIGDIEKAQKDLVSAGASIQEFAKQTKENLNNIFDSQTEIAKGLKDMSARVAKDVDNFGRIKDDVNFLRDFAFSRMTPEEKLNLLKKNPATDLKVKLMESKEKFEASYQKHMQGAQNILIIADRLGVDKKLLSDIQNGLNTVNAIKTGIQLLSNPNYLAAAASVVSMMGGGGEDAVAAARHQQIIARLDRVLENQEKMAAMIKESFEIQVQIMKDLSEQIRQSSQQLYTKMDEVHDAVLWNRVMVRPLLDKGLDSCELVIRNLSETNFKNSLVSLNFRHFLKTCSQEYELVFKLKKFAPYFGSQTFATPDTKDTFSGDETMFKEAIGFMNVTYASRYYPSTSLRNPSATAFGLLEKLAYLSGQNPTPIESAAIQGDLEVFNVRLFAPGVARHVGRLISLYPYITLWNSRISESTEEIMNLGNIKPDAGYSEVKLLDSALELVNATIQQESLIKGDILLPALYGKFNEIQTEGVDCAKDENAKHTRCLLPQSLAKNKQLRRNFMIFGLYNEFYQRSLSAYKQALNIPNDPAALNGILKNKWNIAWSEKEGKYVSTIAGIAQELPTFEEVSSAKLEFSNQLADLLRTREELINLKAEVSMNKNLSPEQKNVIHGLFLN